MTSPTTDDTIDLAARPVPGGYFVRRAAAPARTPFLTVGASDGNYRFSFTYVGGGSTTRADLLDLLSGAQHKIFVASFFIGDAQVREALCEAADRLRGGVYVISAMNERQFRNSVNEADEHETEDVDEATQRKRFEELTRRGVAVRAYDGCHAKFAIVDDRRALVSSANFTTAGLDRTGENGVVVDSRHEAEQLGRFFAVLWHSYTWEMPMGADPVVRTRTAAPRPIRLPQPMSEAHGPLWTLNDQHHIKSTIMELIESAETELLLATFSLDGMIDRPDLMIEHLAKAIERGVRVRLLLRGRNNVPAHVRDAARLADMGIALFPCSLNHAKGVIADRKRGALFSANFDAQRGIDSGVELGTRLDGTAALDAALGFFEHSITERDLDYVRDPTAGELAATIFSRRVSPWPWPTTIHLTTSDTDWTRLKDATQGPTLFVTGTEGTELYAGRRAWQLTMSSEPTSPTPARLVGLNDRQPVAADARLAQWLTAREPKDAHRGTRGICPASLHRVDPPEGGAT